MESDIVSTLVCSCHGWFCHRVFVSGFPRGPDFWLLVANILRASRSSHGCERELPKVCKFRRRTTRICLNEREALPEKMRVRAGQESAFWGARFSCLCSQGFGSQPAVAKLKFLPPGEWTCLEAADIGPVAVYPFLFLISRLSCLLAIPGTGSTVTSCGRVSCTGGWAPPGTTMLACAPSFATGED